MSELDALFDKLDQGGAPDQAPAAPAEGSGLPAAKAKAKAPPAEKYSKSMLFVRGIPRDATNSELEGFFSSVGPVRSCFVVGVKTEQPAGDGDAGDAVDAGADKVSGDKAGNRGFGFVQYVLAEDATRAIEELGEAKFRDRRPLMLDFAMRKHAQTGGDAEGDRPPKRPRQDVPWKQPSEPRTKTPRVGSNSKGQGTESRTVTIGGIPAG
ncbi:RNA recognition motif-containing protein, partial [Coemansia spiralis]